jgi:hypothetical protein
MVDIATRQLSFPLVAIAAFVWLPILMLLLHRLRYLAAEGSSPPTPG